MDSPGLSFLLKSIGFQTPQILVYLTGLVLALAFVRRCPTAAILTLVAMAVLLMTTFGHAFAFAYIIHAQIGHDWQFPVMNVLSVTRGLAHGLGLALFGFGRICWT